MKRLLKKLIKMARTVNIQKMRGIIKSYGPRADPIGLPAVKVVALFFFPAFPLLFFRVSCSISASCYHPKSVIARKKRECPFPIIKFSKIILQLISYRLPIFFKLIRIWARIQIHSSVNHRDKLILWIYVCIRSANRENFEFCGKLYRIYIYFNNYLKFVMQG